MRLEPVKAFGHTPVIFHANGLSTDDVGDGTVGEKIRELRVARGMSQEQLAAKVGVVQMTISKLERGAMKRPTYATLTGVAAALGVDVAELSGLGDPPTQYGSTGPGKGHLGDPAGPRYGGGEGHPPEGDDFPLEQLVFALMDPKRYRLSVFDAARRVAREIGHVVAGYDHLRPARNILESAAKLEREGKPLTTTNILAQLAVMSDEQLRAEHISSSRRAVLAAISEHAKADPTQGASGADDPVAGGAAGPAFAVDKKDTDTAIEKYFTAPSAPAPAPPNRKERRAETKKTGTSKK